MTSSNLGFRHTQTFVNPVNRQLSIDQPSLTTDDVRSSSGLTFAHVLTWTRILMFAAVFLIGVWAYANPTSAVEAITTISVSEQERQLDEVTMYLEPLFAGLNMSTPVLDTLVLSNVLNVFVKVFAALIIVACGGIPSRDHLVSRLLVIASQCTAFGTFIETAITDDGVVLRQWFVIVFSIFACGLPALMAGWEAFTEGTRLEC